MSSNFAGQLLTAPPSVETRGRPRQYHQDRAATSTETMRAHRERIADDRKRYIGVLDFETDPFDADNQTEIFPFTACFLSDFEEIVIWETDFTVFVEKLLQLLDDLPEAYTIYAHNGGKFDFMFLVHKLRGRVSFKGRAIMSANLGRHVLRDSAHILPMKLSDWKKDDFDYAKMKAAVREKHRAEIIEYMVNDCRSLLQIVKAFVGEFGFKLSIGQAAMSSLKKVYTVARLADNTDAELRTFFFGGRVECLAGKGHFVARNRGYKLYDVNSMYPNAMARFQHPIGSHFTWRRSGGITSKTIFLRVRCRNFGAFVMRTPDHETSANINEGVFNTTIWEFNMAIELGLIDNIQIEQYVDCDTFSDFSKFITPMYERRFVTKAQMKELRDAGFADDSPEFLAVKKEDIFLKFLLNNSYGKFAQNPRRFKDHYLTDHGAPAPEGFEDQLLPAIRNAKMGYDIWQRPAPIRGFNNVATAASITGAARSILMRAINNATDPIYCDTDSLICRALDNVQIDKKELGAWDLEDEFDEVIIAGKKLYACKTTSKTSGQPDKIKVRSKGVAEGSLTWDMMLKLLEAEAFVDIPARAPTLTKAGTQKYMDRRIRATATQPLRNYAHVPERKETA